MEECHDNMVAMEKLTKNNKDQEKSKNENVQEPLISFQYNSDNIIKMPKSKFDAIVTKEVVKYIVNNETIEESVIDKNKLLNIKFLHSNYKVIENHIQSVDSILSNLNEGLKIDKPLFTKDQSMNVTVKKRSQLDNIKVNKSMGTNIEVITLDDDIEPTSSTDISTGIIQLLGPKSKTLSHRAENKINRCNSSFAVINVENPNKKFKPGP